MNQKGCVEKQQQRREATSKKSRAGREEVRTPPKQEHSSSCGACCRVEQKIEGCFDICLQPSQRVTLLLRGRWEQRLPRLLRHHHCQRRDPRRRRCPWCPLPLSPAAAAAASFASLGGGEAPCREPSSRHRPLKSPALTDARREHTGAATKGRGEWGEKKGGSAA